MRDRQQQEEESKYGDWLHFLGRTIQIRNNFVLFVKNTMGHRFVGLGRLDCFMAVAFYPISQSSNIIVDSDSPGRVFSGETIDLKIADQLLGVRGVTSKSVGRYQG